MLNASVFHASTRGLVGNELELPNNSRILPTMKVWTTGDVSYIFKYIPPRSQLSGRLLQVYIVNSYRFRSRKCGCDSPSAGQQLEA